MCGICGLLSTKKELANPQATIDVMNAAIWHRGPDAQGAYVQPYVALANSRLAIIDLHAGDQPIYNEDRSKVLVYNGETYNYRALRSRLLEQGHRFASDSDSEAIIHLYEEKGKRLVDDLNGMFGFAIWDEQTQELLLARDRYGIKPIYYYWDGETFAFGSEVKCLIAGGYVKPKLDLDAFVELFTFQNIISDHSLFEGVSLLPAGCTLTIGRGGSPKIERYWDALPERTVTGTDEQIAGELREIFEAGVERQLVSDVEVASYLSGGLDTGAVTAMAAKHLDRLTTFVTGFDTSGADGIEADFDERMAAAEMAESFGTHHHELLLDKHDLEMVFPRLIRHLEEPRMSFSYPNYLTAGMTSRWVKVVLSGAGGDELFGGYPWRYSMAEDANYRDGYFGFWNRLLDVEGFKQALTSEALAQVDLARPRELFNSALEPVAKEAALDQFLYFEFKTYLHGLLVLEDKLSMAHSLETRVPFLDNDLVDYALAIPAATKMSDQRSKHLFRTAMTSVLPKTAVHRKKTGFTPPQAAWFKKEQGNYLEATLLSEQALSRGVFRAEFVRDILSQHLSGKANHRLLLWTMLGVEWWHRIFIDGEHAR